MADLEAVLADVSYLMAMEKSKCTPAARASKKIILPDPRWVHSHTHNTLIMHRQLLWLWLKFFFFIWRLYNIHTTYTYTSIKCHLSNGQNACWFIEIAFEKEKKKILSDRKKCLQMKRLSRFFYVTVLH